MAPRRKISSDAVLRALHHFQVENGHPPTIEELRVELGVGSTRTVLRYLQELEEAGRIDRWSGARGIKLNAGHSRQHLTVSVPLLGEAPAGSLLDASENFLGEVRLTPPIATRGKLFLLRVRGDSMNRAVVNDRTIDDGDLVLVEQCAHACAGQVIVALIDGQATIKRYAPGPHYAVLKPDSSNERHAPIVVSDGFSIQGIVIDVIKDGAINIWDA